MSTRTRRLFSVADLAQGARIELETGQAHQLRHVLRQRSGDVVHLFNNRNGEWRARLEIERRAVSAMVVEQVRPPGAEPGPTLAFAALKRSRLELVVEKACELGAAALQPLVTERSVVDRLNVERVGSILREAAEQCERLSVPTLHQLAPLGDWLRARPETPPLYAALERCAAPGLDEALRTHGAGDLLVGPEGGFSVKECALLTDRPGVVTISLGPRILRAETAAIAGLGVMAIRMSR